MEGKFISPIAIRALCFTSCLVKPWRVLCPQAESCPFFLQSPKHQSDQTIFLAAGTILPVLWFHASVWWFCGSLFFFLIAMFLPRSSESYCFLEILPKSIWTPFNVVCASGIFLNEAELLKCKKKKKKKLFSFIWFLICLAVFLALYSRNIIFCKNHSSYVF